MVFCLVLPLTKLNNNAILLYIGVKPNYMTSFITIALTGFLVWSGASTGALQVSSQVSAPGNTAVSEVYSVKLTGYNAVPEQTDSDPNTTASGAKSNYETIVARSRDMAEIFPYGTIISLETPKGDKSCGFKEVEHLVGYRVVADTMHERKRRQMDIMFNMADVVSLGGKPTNPAVVVGVCDITVRIVGKVAIKDIPKTQAELALLVNKKLAMK